MSFRCQKAHFSTKCFGRAWPEIEFIIRWCCGKGAVHSNFEKTLFDSGKWSCTVNTVPMLVGAWLILTVLCWFWMFCVPPHPRTLSVIGIQASTPSHSQVLHTWTWMPPLKVWHTAVLRWKSWGWCVTTKVSCCNVHVPPMTCREGPDPIYWLLSCA